VTCYDADLDMAYILFADEHPGEAGIKLVEVRAARTAPLSGAITTSLENLTLEFDRTDGRLLALEVTGASKALPREFREMAARETRPKPLKPK
jgi:uncharacterized protein YuzE